MFRMDEEYFDVLDENGSKTGEIKPRSVVHRDGDWHRSVHIWALNRGGDIILQRRSANKETNPNMITISCAGHVSAGDDSLSSAIRELKEELNLDAKPEDLQFVTTLKRSKIHPNGLNNNEFTDLYILRTDQRFEDLKRQEEEVSELFLVPYKEFKRMVESRQRDLLIHDDEFAAAFSVLDKEFNK